MAETAKEFKIGDNTLSIIDDMIFLTNVGDINDALALEFDACLKKIVNTEGTKKRNILVDNNRAGKTSFKARQIFSRMMELETTGKVAIFGMNPVARVLASFFIAMVKKGDVRFFATKEESMAWLKSEARSEK
jgi:hypothetical protein